MDGIPGKAEAGIATGNKIFRLHVKGMNDFGKNHALSSFVCRSDVGEAFRPVVNPRIVTFAYGISWTYLIGDVSYEGYKAHLAFQERQQQPSAEGISTKGPSAEGPGEISEVGLTVAKRAIFQATATMLLPALTIHTICKQSAKLLKNSSNVRLRGWGPTVLGLSAVPALPYMFDKPVEHGIDLVWSRLEEWIGVPGALGKEREAREELDKGYEKLKGKIGIAKPDL